MYQKFNPPIKSDFRERIPNPLTVIIPEYENQGDLKIIFNASSSLFKHDMVVIEMEIKVKKEWVGKRKIIRAIVVRDELAMAVVNGYEKSKPEEKEEPYL